MRFNSNIQNQIAVLLSLVDKLQEELNQETTRFIEGKVKEGWAKFVFSSFYYGSHSERGEGDFHAIYLFAPEVDCSRWEGVCFGHGHYGQNAENDAFEAWMEFLDKDSFFEF